MIIQPGRFGDIIICLPIAKYYYDKGYRVEWYCPQEYHDLFRNISYCTPVILPSANYYEVIDLSFGFNGPPERWWQVTKPRWESFVEAKYHLAGVPLEEKWNLVWNRDKQKEDQLFASLNLPKNYIVYHDEGSKGRFSLDLPKSYHSVRVCKKDSYNIFDWYKVLAEAREIHCIDSVLVNFVDSALPDFKTKIFHGVQKYRKPDLTVKRGWKVV